MDSLAQQLVPANYVNDLKEQSPKALETLTLMKVIKCYFCYLLVLNIRKPICCSDCNFAAEQRSELNKPDICHFKGPHHAKMTGLDLHDFTDNI